LKEGRGELFKNLDKALADEEIRISEIKDWPAFKELRSESDFAAWFDQAKKERMPAENN
jgi:hypothetical protein